MTGDWYASLQNEAGKGDALQHDHLFIFLIILGLVPVGARNHGPTQVLLPFGDILPLSIKLPALLIIASVVKKFTTIPKSTPTCRFIIFAYVGGEISDGSGADICRGLGRTYFRVLVEPIAPFRCVVCGIERDVTISLGRRSGKAPCWGSSLTWELSRQCSGACA